MATEKNQKNTKICPVCGTKLSESASRCLVCGTQLNVTASITKNGNTQPKRTISEVKLSLPLAIIIGAVFLILVGFLAYFIFQSTLTPTDGLPTSTPTETIPANATSTMTPTHTLTPTPAPTLTPEPPIQVTVQAGQYCSTFAGLYNVSQESIRILNNLGIDCALSEGMTLMIPRPTITPTTAPSPTIDMTAESDPFLDCEYDSVVVSAETTLFGLSTSYNVPMEEIRAFNGMTNDILRQGDTVKIPLCNRRAFNAPTPTPTNCPPYPAPSLLLPADGQAFGSSADSVALQWSAVADLSNNELYRVTVQDLTSETEKILVQYIRDTKFILPATFRPVDTTAHAIRWSVVVARQTNSGTENPTYIDAGLSSERRVFTWTGTGAAVPEPTPTP
ncbi:MAG: LysM peptidoglycan-binding domain-containing protein [Anaerolineaceae bacterium]